MKKFLKIIVVLLILGIAGYLVYSHYQKKAVLLGVIYADADSVIKIGFHDLKKTLVFDAISSPGYYWKNAKFSKDKKEKDTIVEPDSGIDLVPYSLALYTAKSVKNTVFTTLKIDDNELFEDYTKRYFKEKNGTIKKAPYSYAIDEKAKLIFAWNSEHLIIAMNPKVSFEACKGVFDAVLLEKKIITDSNHPLIKKLSRTQDHITYLKGDSEVSLNFEDGKALLSGLITTKSPELFKTKVNRNAIPNASMQIYFDANFANNENKETVSSILKEVSFFEKNNIDISTFMNDINGVFSLTVKGTTMQTDTIVTYEYDDNFDKIEVKSLQENKAPVMVLDIGTDKKLNSYLSEQGAIENGILKAIPYYIFYAKEDSLNSVFSTDKNSVFTQNKTGSYFFSLDVNVKHLQQDLEIPKADKIASSLETLRINAQQLKGNKVALEGKLVATKPDINIISQLFFAFQEKDTIQ